MKTPNYILDKKGNPTPCSDILVWAKWFETSAKERKVAHTKVGDRYVSTVFLSIDHSFGWDRPLLFETMVFKNEKSVMEGVFLKGLGFNESLDEYTERYSTRTQALAGHKKIVATLRNENRRRKVTKA